MSINTAQIRAARGLLNWTQGDLAARTNISTTSIGSIENDTTKPRESTLQLIQKAFEDAGIEFLPASGVRKRDEMIRIIDGADTLDVINDDIFTTLAAGGGEVLIFGLEERENPRTDEYQKVQDHLDRITSANISERIIIRDGDVNLLAPAEWYRSIADNYFSPYPFFIYGGKIALINWGPPIKAILIESPLFVKTFKSLFEFVWDRAKPLA
jgi:transcriptional regulator with XRE-family HTH domain